jgi:hypothetical protein
MMVGSTNGSDSDSLVRAQHSRAPFGDQIVRRSVAAAV